MTATSGDCPGGLRHGTGQHSRASGDTIISDFVLSRGLLLCPVGIQDVDSKEPEAVAAYMATNGSAAPAPAEAAGARR